MRWPIRLIQQKVKWKRWNSLLKLFLQKPMNVENYNENLTVSRILNTTVNWHVTYLRQDSKVEESSSNASEIKPDHKLLYQKFRTLHKSAWENGCKFQNTAAETTIYRCSTEWLFSKNLTMYPRNPS